jgi:hypothetical protein
LLLLLLDWRGATTEEGVKAAVDPIRVRSARPFEENFIVNFFVFFFLLLLNNYSAVAII